MAFGGLGRSGTLRQPLARVASTMTRGATGNLQPSTDLFEQWPWVTCEVLGWISPVTVGGGVRARLCDYYLSAREHAVLLPSRASDAPPIHPLFFFPLREL